MMTTSDKRREVAQRLREKHRERNAPGMFEVQDAGMQAYGYLQDLVDCLPDGDSAFTVLADLIDPTCEMEDIGDVPESVKRNLSTWSCSECGSPIYNDMTPTYCTYCGFRVTGGERR